MINTGVSIIGSYPISCNDRSSSSSSSCIQLLVLQYREYRKQATIIDTIVSNVNQNSIQVPQPASSLSIIITIITTIRSM